MIAAARHCLSRLTQFEGRTPRELYMPFAHMVTGGVVLGVLLLALQMSSTFSAGPGGTSGGGGFELRMVVILLLFLVLGATGLLAAATVRRLHDVGRSGLWYAAVPASVGLTLLSILIASQGFGANLGVALALRLLASLLFLSAPAQMIFLRLQGDAGPNRFGPPFTPEPLFSDDGPAYRVDSADARIAALLAERAAKKSAPLSRPVAARGFGRRAAPPSTDC